MKRVKIRIGFVGVSTKKLLQLKVRIVNAMNGNKSFPGEQPLVSKVDEIGNELEIVVVGIEAGNRALVPRRDVLTLQLASALTALGESVIVTAAGNYELLCSCGFELYKQATPAGPVTAPKGLTVSDGKFGGIKARVMKMTSAAGYQYEWTPYPMTESSVWDSSRVTYVSYNITRIESGTKYLVRVGAVDRNDDIVYCDPITRVAQ